MKGFDFVDALLKMFHKNRSAQDKIIFLTGEGDLYEHIKHEYDPELKLNVVHIQLVE